MRAVLLAAGVGRRLGEDRPKALLEVGGRTLLERHVENLQALGVPLRVVTGFHADMLTDALPEGTETIHNAEFKRGSLLSLAAGLAGLDEDVLIMDADVLYDPSILADLLVPTRAFALDPRTEVGEEEMMLGVRDGEVRAIRRGMKDGFELLGEGVGFFKCDAASLPTLHAAIEASDPEGDYEAAIDRLVEAHGADYVLVGDRPWTEIDFPEDVVRAETEILPALGE